MSGKNQWPITLGPQAVGVLPNTPGVSWQSTNPATGFLPLNNNTANIGSVPSGHPIGAMASTNTIYSQIMDVSRADNIGIEVNFNVTGNAVGTFQVMVSNSGINFDALTFTIPLAQPTGSPLAYFVNLTQLAAKYVMLQYTNTSGTGTMTAYIQMKDLN